MDTECPFTILGINKDGASKKVVLKAWRRKMRKLHSDKTGDGDDTSGKVLNDAKERALKDVTDKSMTLGNKAQQEFEESFGMKIEEERLDELWRILTGQRDLGDVSTQTEQSETAKLYMDKDRFKQGIFGILFEGLGL